MDEIIIQMFQNIASRVDLFLIAKTLIEAILFVVVLNKTDLRY